jgi:uncharacterized membrane protein YdbT with pleckstrin-like domain
VNGDPYVMPHERRIMTIRQHPVTVLARPLILMVLAFAFAVFVTVASKLGAIHVLGWLLFLAAMGLLGWRSVQWSMTYLVLTNLRMLVIDGVFVRRVSMIPLVKVVDMNFERPLLGLMFNYGRLVVEGAHDTHPLQRIGYLPRIDEVYAVICGMIFSDPEAREE